jgi:hypothetical protein
VNLDNGGQSDDGDGQGCAAAGVKPGKATDPSTLNQGQTNVQANGKNPSDLEYLWTISTHQIPRYDPNDLPLNDNARRIFLQVGNIVGKLPTVCGGGAYVYAGRTIDLGAVHGFAGAINEYDSEEGVATGTLVEAGAGEALEGGFGRLTTTNSAGTSASSALVYAGAGAHAGGASGSVGTVAFYHGAGVYAEGSFFGKGGGVGAYLNITTNSACESGKK